MNRHHDFPPVSLPFLPGREVARSRSLGKKEEKTSFEFREVWKLVFENTFRKQPRRPEQAALPSFPVARLRQRIRAKEPAAVQDRRRKG